MILHGKNTRHRDIDDNIMLVLTHSARVIHNTFYSDVTSRGRPNLGPYVSFPDVLLRPDVRRTSFVRPIRTRRREDVFSTSATNKDVPKTYARAQISSSSRRPMTSCRVGYPNNYSITKMGNNQKGLGPRNCVYLS